MLENPPRALHEQLHGAEFARVPFGLVGREAHPAHRPHPLHLQIERLARGTAPFVLRAKHGKAGVEFAKTRDWDEINSVVLNVYKDLLKTKQKVA